MRRSIIIEQLSSSFIFIQHNSFNPNLLASVYQAFTILVTAVELLPSDIPQNSNFTKYAISFLSTLFCTHRIKELVYCSQTISILICLFDFLPFILVNIAKKHMRRPPSRLTIVLFYLLQIFSLLYFMYFSNSIFLLFSIFIGEIAWKIFFHGQILQCFRLFIVLLSFFVHYITILTYYASLMTSSTNPAKIASFHLLRMRHLITRMIVICYILKHVLVFLAYFPALVFVGHIFYILHDSSRYQPLGYNIGSSFLRVFIVIAMGFTKGFFPLWLLFAFYHHELQFSFPVITGAAVLVCEIYANVSKNKRKKISMVMIGGNRLSALKHRKRHFDKCFVTLHKAIDRYIRSQGSLQRSTPDGPAPKAAQAARAEQSAQAAQADLQSKIGTAICGYFDPPKKMNIDMPLSLDMVLNLWLHYGAASYSGVLLGPAPYPRVGGESESSAPSGSDHQNTQRSAASAHARRPQTDPRTVLRELLGHLNSDVCFDRIVRAERFLEQLRLFYENIYASLFLSYASCSQSLEHITLLDIEEALPVPMLVNYLASWSTPSEVYNSLIYVISQHHAVESIRRSDAAGESERVVADPFFWVGNMDKPQARHRRARWRKWRETNSASNDSGLAQKQQEAAIPMSKIEVTLTRLRLINFLMPYVPGSAVGHESQRYCQRTRARINVLIKSAMRTYCESSTLSDASSSLLSDSSKWEGQRRRKIRPYTGLVRCSASSKCNAVRSGLRASPRHIEQTSLLDNTSTMLTLGRDSQAKRGSRKYKRSWGSIRKLTLSNSDMRHIAQILNTYIVTPQLSKKTGRMGAQPAAHGRPSLTASHSDMAKFFLKQPVPAQPNKLRNKEISVNPEIGLWNNGYVRPSNIIYSGNIFYLDMATLQSLCYSHAASPAHKQRVCDSIIRIYRQHSNLLFYVVLPYTYSVSTTTGNIHKLSFSLDVVAAMTSQLRRIRIFALVTLARIMFCHGSLVFGRYPLHLGLNYTFVGGTIDRVLQCTPYLTVRYRSPFTLQVAADPFPRRSSDDGLLSCFAREKKYKDSLILYTLLPHYLSNVNLQFIDSTMLQFILVEYFRFRLAISGLANRKTLDFYQVYGSNGGEFYERLSALPKTPGQQEVPHTGNQMEDHTTAAHFVNALIIALGCHYIDDHTADPYTVVSCCLHTRMRLGVHTSGQSMQSWLTGVKIRLTTHLEYCNALLDFQLEEESFDERLTTEDQYSSRATSSHAQQRPVAYNTNMMGSVAADAHRGKEPSSHVSLALRPHSALFNPTNTPSWSGGVQTMNLGRRSDRLHAGGCERFETVAELESYRDNVSVALEDVSRLLHPMKHRAEFSVSDDEFMEIFSQPLRQFVKGYMQFSIQDMFYVSFDANVFSQCRASHFGLVSNVPFKPSCSSPAPDGSGFPLYEHIVHVLSVHEYVFTRNIFAFSSYYQGPLSPLVSQGQSLLEEEEAGCSLNESKRASRSDTNDTILQSFLKFSDALSPSAFCESLVMSLRFAIRNLAGRRCDQPEHGAPASPSDQLVPVPEHEQIEAQGFEDLRPPGTDGAFDGLLRCSAEFMYSLLSTVNSNLSVLYRTSSTYVHHEEMSSFYVMLTGNKLHSSYSKAARSRHADGFTLSLTPQSSSDPISMLLSVLLLSPDATTPREVFPHHPDAENYDAPTARLPQPPQLAQLSQPLHAMGYHASRHQRDCYALKHYFLYFFGGRYTVDMSPVTAPVELFLNVLDNSLAATLADCRSDMPMLQKVDSILNSANEFDFMAPLLCDRGWLDVIVPDRNTPTFLLTTILADYNTHYSSLGSLLTAFSERLSYFVMIHEVVYLLTYAQSHDCTLRAKNSGYLLLPRIIAFSKRMEDGCKEALSLLCDIVRTYDLSDRSVCVRLHNEQSGDLLSGRVQQALVSSARFSSACPASKDSASSAGIAGSASVSASAPASARSRGGHTVRYVSGSSLNGLNALRILHDPRVETLMSMFEQLEKDFLDSWALKSILLRRSFKDTDLLEMIASEVYRSFNATFGSPKLLHEYGIDQDTLLANASETVREGSSARLQMRRLRRKIRASCKITRVLKSLSRDSGPASVEKACEAIQSAAARHSERGHAATCEQGYDAQSGHALKRTLLNICDLYSMGINNRVDFWLISQRFGRCLGAFALGKKYVFKRMFYWFTEYPWELIHRRDRHIHDYRMARRLYNGLLSSFRWYGPAVPSTGSAEATQSLDSSTHELRRADVNILRELIYPDGSGDSMVSTEEHDVCKVLSCLPNYSCSSSEDNFVDSAEYSDVQSEGLETGKPGHSGPDPLSLHGSLYQRYHSVLFPRSHHARDLPGTGNNHTESYVAFKGAYLTFRVFSMRAGTGGRLSYASTSVTGDVTPHYNKSGRLLSMRTPCDDRCAARTFHRSRDSTLKHKAQAIDDYEDEISAPRNTRDDGSQFFQEIYDRIKAQKMTKDESLLSTVVDHPSQADVDPGLDSPIRVHLDSLLRCSDGSEDAEGLSAKEIQFPLPLQSSNSGLFSMQLLYSTLDKPVLRDQLSTASAIRDADTSTRSVPLFDVSAFIRKDATPSSSVRTFGPSSAPVSMDTLITDEQIHPDVPMGNGPTTALAEKRRENTKDSLALTSPAHSSRGERGEGATQRYSDAMTLHGSCSLPNTVLKEEIFACADSHRFREPSSHTASNKGEDITAVRTSAGDSQDSSETFVRTFFSDNDYYSRFNASSSVPEELMLLHHSHEPVCIGALQSGNTKGRMSKQRTRGLLERRHTLEDLSEDCDLNGTSVLSLGGAPSHKSLPRMVTQSGPSPRRRIHDEILSSIALYSEEGSLFVDETDISGADPNDERTNSYKSDLQATDGTSSVSSLTSKKPASFGTSVIAPEAQVVHRHSQSMNAHPIPQPAQMKSTSSSKLESIESMLTSSGSIIDMRVVAANEGLRQTLRTIQTKSCLCMKKRKTWPWGACAHKKQQKSPRLLVLLTMLLQFERLRQAMYTIRYKVEAGNLKSRMHSTFCSKLTITLFVSYTILGFLLVFYFAHRYVTTLAINGLTSYFAILSAAMTKLSFLSAEVSEKLVGASNFASTDESLQTLVSTVEAVMDDLHLGHLFLGAMFNFMRLDDFSTRHDYLNLSIDGAANRNVSTIIATTTEVWPPPLPLLNFQYLMYNGSIDIEPSCNFTTGNLANERVQHILNFAEKVKPHWWTDLFPLAIVPQIFKEIWSMHQLFTMDEHYLIGSFADRIQRDRYYSSDLRSFYKTSGKTKIYIPNFYQYGEMTFFEGTELLAHEISCTMGGIIYSGFRRIDYFTVSRLAQKIHLLMQMFDDVFVPTFDMVLRNYLLAAEARTAQLGTIIRMIFTCGSIYFLYYFYLKDIVSKMNLSILDRGCTLSNLFTSPYKFLSLIRDAYSASCKIPFRRERYSLADMPPSAKQCFSKMAVIGYHSLNHPSDRKSKRRRRLGEMKNKSFRSIPKLHGLHASSRKLSIVRSASQYCSPDQLLYDNETLRTSINSQCVSRASIRHRYLRRKHTESQLLEAERHRNNNAAFDPINSRAFFATDFLVKRVIHRNTYSPSVMHLHPQSKYPPQLGGKQSGLRNNSTLRDQQRDFKKMGKDPSDIHSEKGTTRQTVSNVWGEYYLMQLASECLDIIASSFRHVTHSVSYFVPMLCYAFFFMIVVSISHYKKAAFGITLLDTSSYDDNWLKKQNLWSSVPSVNGPSPDDRRDSFSLFTKGFVMKTLTHSLPTASTLNFNLSPAGRTLLYLQTEFSVDPLTPHVLEDYEHITNFAHNLSMQAGKRYISSSMAEAVVRPFEQILYMSMWSRKCDNATRELKDALVNINSSEKLGVAMDKALVLLNLLHVNPISTYVLLRNSIVLGFDYDEPGKVDNIGGLLFSQIGGALVNLSDAADIFTVWMLNVPLPDMGAKLNIILQRIAHKISTLEYRLQFYNQLNQLPLYRPEDFDNAVQQSVLAVQDYILSVVFTNSSMSLVYAFLILFFITYSFMILQISVYLFRVVYASSTVYKHSLHNNNYCNCFLSNMIDMLYSRFTYTLIFVLYWTDIIILSINIMYVIHSIGKSVYVGGFILQAWRSLSPSLELNIFLGQALILFIFGIYYSSLDLLASLGEPNIYHHKQERALYSIVSAEHEHRIPSSKSGLPSLNKAASRRGKSLVASVLRSNRWPSKFILRPYHLPVPKDLSFANPLVGSVAESFILRIPRQDSNINDVSKAQDGVVEKTERYILPKFMPPLKVSIPLAETFRKKIFVSILMFLLAMSAILGRVTYFSPLESPIVLANLNVGLSNVFALSATLQELLSPVFYDPPVCSSVTHQIERLTRTLAILDQIPVMHSSLRMDVDAFQSITERRPAAPDYASYYVRSLETILANVPLTTQGRCFSQWRASAVDLYDSIMWYSQTSMDGWLESNFSSRMAFFNTEMISKNVEQTYILPATILSVMVEKIVAVETALAGHFNRDMRQYNPMTSIGELLLRGQCLVPLFCGGTFPQKNVTNRQHFYVNMMSQAQVYANFSQLSQSEQEKVAMSIMRSRTYKSMAAVQLACMWISERVFSLYSYQELLQLMYYIILFIVGWVSWMIVWPIYIQEFLYQLGRFSMFTSLFLKRIRGIH